MQRRRLSIALRHIGEFDQRAHLLQPRALSAAGVTDPGYM
jgi:hypothetical protein